ncbi:MAG: hypothetical protein K2O04_00260 [Clostridiales bacterium]|nr:hypothetical protein [Clostridiales bacterium]
MKKLNLAILIICIVLPCLGILNSVLYMKHNQAFYIVGAVLDGLALVLSIVCTVLHVRYYRKHQEESHKFYMVAVCYITLCSIYFLIGQVVFVWKF